MSETERIVLAQARADEAAARVRREVLERELRALDARPNVAAPPKRAAKRSLPSPVDPAPANDLDDAAARNLARELGLPIRATLKAVP